MQNNVLHISKHKHFKIRCSTVSKRKICDLCYHCWSGWLRGMILASHAKGPGFDPDLCRVEFFVTTLN